ncbi:hypothetical protein HGRIS_009620 [Hohenbuehelia grisea]|uniref:holo-[acyl-carrier-protein] synthase n=1 Tax=Hohenbuehelia grisea TaxID=104357 RepID=A0ABR3J245_9AGAR
MQVKAVVYGAQKFSEDLYQRALTLVDTESAARIKRFYKRDDACRTLIGRLLLRKVLNERGVASSDVTFGITTAKKPYIVSINVYCAGFDFDLPLSIEATPELHPPLGFNITHDNALIAIAVCEGVHHPPAYSIGIDVMKIRVPGRDTFASFVHTVSDQLTAREYRLIFDATQEEGLRRFFWMWTMKEAYTKALGIGLGFDFKRVEYDVPEEVIRVDGEVPKGWEFRKFEIMDNEDLYQGVVAQYVGGEEPATISPVQLGNDWVVRYDAASFAEEAIQAPQ